MSLSVPSSAGAVEAAADPRGKRESSKEGYDFSQSGVENITHKRFDFGPQGSQPVNVDQTLATLFDTLSVECR